jgi:hypothetical protein
MQQLLITILLFTSICAFADDRSEIDKLSDPVLALFSKGQFDKIASTALAQSTIADYISKSDMECLLSMSLAEN